MRNCPFDGCPAQISDKHFACARHWYQIDKPRQDRIWAAYREYTRGAIDLDTLRTLQQQVLDELQAAGRTA